MLANQLDDAEDVIAKEIQSIDVVSKQKKQGLYIEDMTIDSLKRAEELGRIYTTVSSSNQSYRITNPSVTPCHDEQASMTQLGHVHETSNSTTLDAFQRNFEDFKRFSHVEILSLKAQKAPKFSDGPTRT